eukprot:1181917-Prorocentrum_minimum.AAC.7
MRDGLAGCDERPKRERGALLTRPVYALSSHTIGSLQRYMPSPLTRLNVLGRTQVLEWTEGMTAPESIFTASVSNCDDNLREHRTAFNRASAVNGGCGPDAVRALGPGGTDVFVLEIKRWSRPGDPGALKAVPPAHRFLVTQALGHGRRVEQVRPIVLREPIAGGEAAYTQHENHRRRGGGPLRDSKRGVIHGP